jgi:hypothetical protein
MPKARNGEGCNLYAVVTNGDPSWRICKYKMLDRTRLDRNLSRFGPLLYMTDQYLKPFSVTIHPVLYGIGTLKVTKSALFTNYWFATGYLHRARTDTIIVS